MPDEDKCEGCQSRDSCKEIYKLIGSGKGPSVTVRVLIAFVMPLAVFIAALIISENILASKLDSEAAITALSLIIAVITSALAVLIVRALLKKRMNL
jgi:hypothetical protein